MYTRKEIATARKIAKASHNVNGLLADPSSNPKTEKNSRLMGILTAPLHLAPGKLSGYQVCPMASAGCLSACLHTAGNPAYMANKEKARINRTRLYFEDRAVFLTILWAELVRHEKRAAKVNQWAGARLNATSDIAWESVRFPNGQNIFETFPAITFYDYTAIPKRMKVADAIPNYHLTFSAKENNTDACLDVLNNGGTVAMPFSTKRGQSLPAEFMGFPIIDADKHDYRPSDPAGHIAGLRAKGDARYDTSGFVRQV